MNIYFQTRAAHADWIFNPGRIIDFEFLWNDMNDFTIRGNQNSFGRFNHSLNIVLSNFFILNWYYARRIEAVDMVASNADGGGLELINTGHEFSFGNG